MKVGQLGLRIEREKSLIMFSIIVPLGDVWEEPHMGLWAFRSPRMI